MSADTAMPTEHPKILRAIDSVFTSDGNARIDELIAAAAANVTPREIRRLIGALVPEYANGHDKLDLAVVSPTPARGNEAGVKALASQ